MTGDKEKNTAIGVKHDKEKLRYDLLPIKPIEAIVRVLGYGGKKYTGDNWKHVPDCQRRYYAACMRHITAWWDGEKLDSETGESHLAHAATCLIFMMWHEIKEKEETKSSSPDRTEDKEVRPLATPAPGSGVPDEVPYSYPTNTGRTWPERLLRWIFNVRY